jgi:uncharacterized protein (DUF427 family)
MPLRVQRCPTGTGFRIVRCSDGRWKRCAPLPCWQQAYHCANNAPCPVYVPCDANLNGVYYYPAHDACYTFSSAATTTIEPPAEHIIDPGDLEALANCSDAKCVVSCCSISSGGVIRCCYSRNSSAYVRYRLYDVSGGTETLVLTYEGTMPRATQCRWEGQVLATDSNGSIMVNASLRPLWYATTGQPEFELTAQTSTHPHRSYYPTADTNHVGTTTCNSQTHDFYYPPSSPTQRETLDVTIHNNHCYAFEGACQQGCEPEEDEGI